MFLNFGFKDKNLFIVYDEVEEMWSMESYHNVRVASILGVVDSSDVNIYNVGSVFSINAVPKIMADVHKEVESIIKVVTESITDEQLQRYGWLNILQDIVEKIISDIDTYNWNKVKCKYNYSVYCNRVAPEVTNKYNSAISIVVTYNIRDAIILVEYIADPYKAIFDKERKCVAKLRNVEVCDKLQHLLRGRLEAETYFGCAKYSIEYALYVIWEHNNKELIKKAYIVYSKEVNDIFLITDSFRITYSGYNKNSLIIMREDDLHLQEILRNKEDFECINLQEIVMDFNKEVIKHKLIGDFKEFMQKKRKKDMDSMRLMQNTEIRLGY